MIIAYFDCFSGVSGDMILGALVDAGLGIEALREELAKLKVAGFRLETEKVEKHGIVGTKVNVVTGHEHVHRYLADIVKIIEGADISDAAKTKGKAVFARLADAEAKVHGTTPDRIHFHEVGALDAIVDVLGSILGLELLGVEEVYASALRMGTGFTSSAHGRLPVPVPAVVELTRGIPTERTQIRAELITPTGAAILTALSTSIGNVPFFRTERVGYGAGTRDLEEIPNLLRVHIGAMSGQVEEDRSVVIETNIDDMTPEVYGYVLDALLHRGAKDVYLTPVVMKKGRPGILLTVLADEARVEEVVRTIFRETSTFGVRMHDVRRVKMRRQAGSVETRFGTIRTKIGEFEGTIRITPEFDDCARIAQERNVSILEVYRAVQDVAGTLER